MEIISEINEIGELIEGILNIKFKINRPTPTKKPQPN